MPPGAIQDRFKADFIVKLEVRFPIFLRILSARFGIHFGSFGGHFGAVSGPFRADFYDDFLMFFTYSECIGDDGLTFAS